MPATRQTLLSVPFREYAAGSSEARPHEARPHEVRLFVASDDNPAWNLVSRAASGAGRFIFRARRDGRYRFLIQGVFQDAGGARFTKTLARRGVLVDTCPPQVMLKGDRGSDGQVTVSWRAADPHLADDALKLVYRIAPDGPWQPVAVDRAGVLRSGEGESGRVTWWVPKTAEVIDVRAEFVDRAGNMAVGHCQLRTHGSESQGPPVQTAAASDRVSESRLPVLRSLEFEVDYRIEGTRPDRVREVQLWITPDEGAHWSLLASDPDRTSPIAAHVEREGRYGFRIVARGAEGGAAVTPTAGTLPELCLEFDRTPPSVRLTSARHEQGMLALSWEAVDSRLGSRPISLYCGPSRDGPWTELATNHANTGSLTHRLETGKAPDFLRIEATDEAGNVGVDVAAYPMPPRVQGPTARIRVVRPRSRTAEHQGNGRSRR